MSPLPSGDITTVNNSLNSTKRPQLTLYPNKSRFVQKQNKKCIYIKRLGAIFLIQATTPKFDPEGLHSLLYDLKIYFAYTEPKF